MNIGGVEVVDFLGCSEEETRSYIKHIREKTGGDLIRLVIGIAPDGDGVSLDYVVQHRKFERIRRITGYLVGTIERWNDSKQTEERDRVKHA